MRRQRASGVSEVIARILHVPTYNSLIDLIVVLHVGSKSKLVKVVVALNF